MASSVRSAITGSGTCPDIDPDIPGRVLPPAPAGVKSWWMSGGDTLRSLRIFLSLPGALLPQLHHVTLVRCGRSPLRFLDKKGLKVHNS